MFDHKKNVSHSIKKHTTTDCKHTDEKIQVGTGSCVIKQKVKHLITLGREQV